MRFLGVSTCPEERGKKGAKDIFFVAQENAASIYHALLMSD
jgi:hypothetical protein